MDKRTDVWAFGCVLYEMLSGARAFGGDDVTDTLAAVVRAEPDWQALPPGTPPANRKVLKRCLEKNQRERLPDIGAARLDINEALTAPAETAALPASEGSQKGPLASARLAWIGVALLAVVAVATTAVAIALARRTMPVSREVRVDIATPPTTDPVSFALSPDGRHIAFVATSDGQPKLWVRSLDDGSVRTVSGTDGATLPSGPQTAGQSGSSRTSG